MSIKTSHWSPVDFHRTIFISLTAFFWLMIYRPLQLFLYIGKRFSKESYPFLRSYCQSTLLSLLRKHSKPPVCTNDLIDEASLSLYLYRFQTPVVVILCLWFFKAGILLFPILSYRHPVMYVSLSEYLPISLCSQLSPLISASLKMCSYSFLWRISFPRSISEVSICLFISYDFPLSLNFNRKLFLNE